MTNIRDELQQEAVMKYKDKGIYYLAPRFGKIKTTFLLCESMGWTNIKILAPRNDIFEGWKNDQEKFGFKGTISYCTFTSLSKEEVDENIDLIVIDEIHEASDNQLRGIKPLIKSNKSIGLTGTMTYKTLSNIEDILKMKVCHKYSIAQGVKDEILTNYRIILHEVPLDNIDKYIVTKKGKVSERQRFEQLVWLKDKLKKENKSVFFLDLKIISLIQNSVAKKNKTIELLNKSKTERVLVFCGTTAIADDLGIPVYHSKNKEKEVFTDFCNGQGNHLATIKMMQAGITIKPISKGIVNYTSGNPEDSAQKICRFLGMEYDNSEKKAEIHIICTTTSFEKERIQTALMFFDERKISKHNS